VTKKKSKAVVAPPALPVITSIKGFDYDLSCRGFMFEVGKTYEVSGTIAACSNGFHACSEDEHPFSVFEFYGPQSRFAIVEQSGATDRQGTKLASASITIKAEIALPDLIQRAVKWVFDRAKPEGPIATGENGLATASGNHGAATASGYRGAATASGYPGAATASGYQGAATASGYQGAATASGYRGAATASGYQGAATASGLQGAATASGYHGAATASGYQGAATASGNHGAATASGYQGAATASGYRGAATASGYQGAAISTAPEGRVRGDVNGVDLFAREFEWIDGKWKRLSIACGTTGENGIEVGRWYVCKGGKLVEWEA